MGMSASQVRFLSLQHRKNDIGRELTTLSNRKMGLSRDMNRVSKNYTDALNKTVLRWSNDAGKSYNVMNYDMLMKPNDLNCETPYIITDSQGRVVVDDTKVWFDKENCKLLTGSDVPAGKGVTYRQLAAAISAYSGVDSHTNDLTFLNQSGLGIDSHTLGSFQHDTYSTTAVFGTSSKDGCPYEVVKGIKDYDFENTIRYDLMTQLGILTETENTQFNNILDELYGTQNGLDFEGGYEALLEKFDDDHNYAGAGGDGYDKFFGSLDDSTGELTLKGGCAKGNLALAKAYQREYRSYLHTDIKRSVNHNRNTDNNEADVIVEKSTANSLEEMDNGNTRVVAQYRYDKKSDSGISNRIVGLLTKVNGQDGKVNVLGSPNNYQFTMNIDGVLNNLSFYKNADETAVNFIDAFNRVGNGVYNVYANTRGEDETWGYIEDGRKTVDGSWSWVTTKTMNTWGQLYNSKGNGYEWEDDSKVSLTGYTQGENRPSGDDINQIWDSLEVSSNLVKSNNSGISTYGSGGWFEMLRDSFKHVTGANEEAVDYAYERMCYLYHDGIYDNTENSDGSYSGGPARRHAASECNDNFGVGWANEFGTSDDGIAINASNAIAAFVTFYEMYMRTQENPNLIVNDGSFKTTIFLPVVNKAISKFDDNFAASLVSLGKPLNGAFSEWIDTRKTIKNSMGSNGYSDYSQVVPPAGSSTSAQDYTFSYTYKMTVPSSKEGEPDKETYITETAVVHGKWNGTDMTDVTNITCTSTSGSSPQASDQKPTEETIMELMSDGNYMVTTKRTGYDEDGNETGVLGTTGVITYSCTGTKVIGHVTNIPGTGAPSSVDITYKDGQSSVTLINGITDFSGYTQDGNMYMLLEKVGDDYVVADEYDEMYYIDPGYARKCTITQTITVKPEDTFSQQLDDLVNYWTERVEKLEEDLNKAFGGLENKFMDYFDVLFKRISQNGWVYDEKVNNQSDKKASTNYLNTMLQNNKYYLTEARELTGDAKYNYTMKIAEDVVKVYEVHDTNAENQALAEYESAKTMIAMKEKKIDARMAKLETEQQVINTELDSIEKVRNDNIEKYFKIFA